MTAIGPGAFTGTSTTTVAAVGGVATFSNLHLNTAGSYVITAASTGVSGATSSTFTISAAAAGLVSVAHEWLDALHGGANVTRGGHDGLSQTRLQSSLTPRELEVLRMIAEGLGNKQIAARLAISEHTVKFHVGSVFAKMRVSTRAEAVMLGARRGLIVL